MVVAHGKKEEGRKRPNRQLPLLLIGPFPSFSSKHSQLKGGQRIFKMFDVANVPVLFNRRAASSFTRILQKKYYLIIVIYLIINNLIGYNYLFIVNWLVKLFKIFRLTS